MERTLTVFFTGLCLSPLFFLLGLTLVMLLTEGDVGSDKTIANSYIAFLVGFLLMVVGFFLTIYLAGRYLQPAYLNHLQLADCVIVLLWFVAWVWSSGYEERSSASRDIHYEGYQFRLEMETRVEKSLLADAPVDSVVAIRFMGGQTSEHFPQPEAIQEDGTGVILPWTTVPTWAHSWYVIVDLHKKPMYFFFDGPGKLNATRPETKWSDWLKPTFYYTGNPEPAGYAQGVRLRARYRLVANHQP